VHINCLLWVGSILHTLWGLFFFPLSERWMGLSDLVGRKAIVHWSSSLSESPESKSPDETNSPPPSMFSRCFYFINDFYGFGWSDADQALPILKSMVFTDRYLKYFWQVILKTWSSTGRVRSIASPFTLLAHLLLKSITGHIVDADWAQSKGLYKSRNVWIMDDRFSIVCPLVL